MATVERGAWHVGFKPGPGGTVILSAFPYVTDREDGRSGIMAKLTLSVEELDKLITEGREALANALFPPVEPEQRVIHYPAVDRIDVIGTDVTLCGIQAPCDVDVATCPECLAIIDADDTAPVPAGGEL